MSAAHPSRSARRRERASSPSGCPRAECPGAAPPSCRVVACRSVPMDGSHVDALSHALIEPRSRRRLTRLLSGLTLSGPLTLFGLGESAAKKKKRCPPCKTRKHGKCKQTLPDGTACVGGACQGGRCVSSSPPPPVVCPPTCPVCQTCNASTGGCEVRPDGNGQPGQNCQAPRVCCSGTCCDAIHACNSGGACASCAEVCGPTCTECLTLADGGTLCSTGSGCSPGDFCTSSAGCAAGRVCATSYTLRATNVTGQLCGAPVGTGVCYATFACP
jgi:hypothetical protein